MRKEEEAMPQKIRARRHTTQLRSWPPCAFPTVWLEEDEPTKARVGGGGREGGTAGRKRTGDWEWGGGLSPDSLSYSWQTSYWGKKEAPLIFMKDPHPQTIVGIHAHVTVEGSRGHTCSHFEALSTGMDGINGSREGNIATFYRRIHAKKWVWQPWVPCSGPGTSSGVKDVKDYVVQ